MTLFSRTTPYGIQSRFTTLFQLKKMLKPSRHTKKIFISEHVSIVNLAPAVMTLPFGVNTDSRDTVRYKDVMKEYGLGHNGGILTSLLHSDQDRTPSSRPCTVPFRGYHVGPEWRVITAWSSYNDIYIIRKKDFFLSMVSV